MLERQLRYHRFVARFVDSVTVRPFLHDLARLRREALHMGSLPPSFPGVAEPDLGAERHAA